MALAAEQTEEEPQFRIEATGSFREPRTRVLKHGDAFAVMDPFGDMLCSDGSPDGLYRQDTRYLSQLELRLNGERPLLLSADPADDGAVLTVDLANPDITAGDGSVLHRELIYLNRRQFLWQGAYYEQVLVRNYDLAEHLVTIGVRFGADFADVFEVRGLRRAKRGKSSAQRSTGNIVLLRYRGLDGVERITDLHFDPEPAQLDTIGALYVLKLDPGKWRRLAWRISCGPADRKHWDLRGYYRALRAARHDLRDLCDRAAHVTGANVAFNELASRSLSDLYMLTTRTDSGLYPFAGIPWFSTVFGRDGIITALLCLWLDPTIAQGVLRFLAATQATDIDPERDAEPGKILHEMRHGEMARLGEVPFARYYGSVDATPLFIMLMGEYFARTGDLGTVRELWPNVEAALAWIDTYGDRDGDGFVEYDRQSAAGLSNQGWKDSSDSIFHQDGELAQGAIALCEVQGYIFAAKRHAAALAGALGHAEAAARLADQAEALRQRFEAAFWCEDLATYALALDGAKRPCRVIASNAGHALLTGIAAPDRAARVAQTLLGAGCFSGWGVRTLAHTSVRYNPISYHNGSVWPHDNALIALGLARYGLKDAALRIFTGLFEAARFWEPRRLPELFCGFARRRNAPTRYPVACSPQAWASACVFGLVQAALGLKFHPLAGEIGFDRPMLPKFLETLDLRGLRLNGATADVRLHRTGGEVAATVTRRDGDIRVVVTH